MEFGFAARLKRLQRFVEKRRLDAIMLTAGEGFDANAYYYSGDDSFPVTLIVTPENTTIFTLHPRDFKSLFDEAYYITEARKRLKKMTGKWKAVGADDFSRSAGTFLRRKHTAKARVVPVGAELGEMRVLKEPAELERIRKAVKVAETCFSQVNSSNIVGKTEHAVCGGMEFSARNAGAALDAFPPMVISGERTAMFHAVTSGRKIGREDAVIIDAGATVDHYCSDLTRTYYAGKDPRIKEAIEAVKEAKKAGERKARVGAMGKEIADAALEIIKEAGFGTHSFREAGLSVGHFVGLDVHDGGKLEKTKLARGMAFTVEPGIYVPGKWGVRFEDTVVL